MTTDLTDRVKTLITLFTAFGKAGDTDRIKVYASLTKEIPLEVLTKACHKVALEEEYLPPVARIIKACESLLASKAAPDSVLAENAKSATMAWAEVMQAMSDYGIHQVPQWSSKSVEQAVRAMGWRNLCYAEESNIGVLRAQFMKIYDGILKDRADRAVNGFVLGENPKGILGMPLGHLNALRGNSVENRGH